MDLLNGPFNAFAFIGTFLTCFSLGWLAMGTARLKGISKAWKMYFIAVQYFLAFLMIAVYFGYKGAMG